MAERRLPLLLLALAAGCGGPDRPPEPLALIRWEGTGGDPVRDRGIGVLAPLGDAAGPPGAGPVDSVIVRREAGRDSPLLGVVLRGMPDSLEWGWFVRGPAALRPNLVEYGYEEAGVPFDSASGGWLRVVLGHDLAGAPVRGWALPRPGRDTVIRWAGHLPAMPLFWLEGEAPALAETPGGAVTPFPVPVGPDDDYIMWAEEARGEWLRVRVVSPADYCAEPGSPGVWRGWIRYLREDGRPRVWYYTRGC